MIKHYQVICILLLFYILQIGFCNPFVDFPIGDDWSYAKAVKNLVEEGQLKYTGWTSMPLVLQVLWGGLFSLPFGFSHIALRLSTIVLAFAGGCGTYAVANRITNGNQVISFIIALLVVANPYYNQLAFSFNTDIPFFAFFIWSIYFLVMYLEERRTIHFAVGAFMLVLATLIRDITIVVPIALGVACFIKKGTGWKQLVRPFLLLLLIIAVIYLFRYYLMQTQGLPALYDHAKTRLLNAVRNGFLKFLVIAAQYFVLSICIVSVGLLPLTLLRMQEIVQVIRRKYIWIPVVLLLGACSGVVWLSPRLVNIFSTNILSFLYCGELDYQQERITPGVIVANFSPLLNIITYFIAILSTILVICGFIGIVKRSHDKGQWIKQTRPVTVFFMAFIILYLLLISPAGIYPRYLIPLVPLVAILLLCHVNFATIPGRYKKVLIFSFIVYVYVGFGAAYDQMQTYGAREKALRHLTEKMKVPPEKIDGGFEFNGWHFYNPTAIARPGQNWWWVIEDEYIVALSELKNYTTIYKVPYRRILPVGKWWMYVMKKDGS